MVKWFKDIFPCSSCTHGPYVGSTCRKGHHTTYTDGCKDCGMLVSSEWFYFDKKCPDFTYYEPHDPSGS